MLFMVVIFSSLSTNLYAQTKKPNILVIFGDDIGYSNISAYNLGMMGYHTPNIDRVAQQGALFTDYYAQQSCTAGRAAFITGQSPFRTGLLKVGLPGADLGLQPQDPTIADLLKSRGYMTFQNGKNHLGDRNEFLPTVHGFDEFFGNFYHLNAEERGLSQEPSIHGEVRPAWRVQVQGHRHGQSRATRSPFWSVGQAGLHRHWPADQAAHGNRG
jgi:arylsulfatase A-like enzyme